jgi:hypothetical protein
LGDWFDVSACALVAAIIVNNKTTISPLRTLAMQTGSRIADVHEYIIIRPYLLHALHKPRIKGGPAIFSV